MLCVCYGIYVSSRAQQVALENGVNHSITKELAQSNVALPPPGEHFFSRAIKHSLLQIPRLVFSYFIAWATK